jgi:hypothetical protein
MACGLAGQREERLKGFVLLEVAVLSLLTTI